MIESIDRALAILQLFLQEETPLSITEISRKMKLHKSTVSRTMDTLEGRGFVRKQDETGKYWLGLQVYSLGMLFREKESFLGAEVAKLPTTSIRMAIAFIAMLPLFIIYPFLQKYFAEGITLGAVKG